MIHTTTFVERALIATTVFLLPLDDHLPTLLGHSVLFYLFGTLAMYALIHRSSRMARVLLHTVFLAAFGFLIIGFVVESLHGSPMYDTLLRTIRMLVGGIAIAALCRDSRALHTLLHAQVAGSVVLSLLLFSSSYSALSATSASNYQEAQIARAQIDVSRTVGGDLNALSCYAAIGAAIALSLALGRVSLLKRAVCIGAASLCAVASFLPMSRSGAVILVVSVIVVLHTHGALRVHVLAILLLLGLTLLVAVPHAAFSRMDVSRSDSRGRVYLAILKGLPEYAITGTGAGKYWTEWGSSHGIVSSSGSTLGPHNAFLQSLVYWGFLGLLGFAGVVWAAAQCVPKRFAADSYLIAIRAIAVAGLLWLMVVHTIWDKQFSLILGLLVTLDLSLVKSVSRNASLEHTMATPLPGQF